MNKLPTLFLSHGAPTLPLESGAVPDFLKQLGQTLPTPKAILVVSAHWETKQPLVSAATHPRTIHDFSGFPKELYQMQYPAPGAPKLAARVVELLADAGMPCEVSVVRGLDHGAWTPLILMYPPANIPVTQLSIQPGLSPQYHFQLGQSLQSLRDEGVLILASGNATHNLRELNPTEQAISPEWVTQFAQWLDDAILAGNTESLLHYRELAPFAVRNHPTDEHLLPMFVAMGAAGNPVEATQLHSSFTYGVLSMAAYAFDSKEAGL
jgi:4,5-DOPA dioxygenase extradiol